MNFGVYDDDYRPAADEGEFATEVEFEELVADEFEELVEELEQEPEPEPEAEPEPEQVLDKPVVYVRGPNGALHIQ